MILETLVVGMLQVNCYLLGCSRTGLALVIDPGANATTILQALARHSLRLERILATHGHFDHLMACRALHEKTAAGFFIHAADEMLAEGMQRTAMAWLGIEPDPVPAPAGYLVPGQDLVTGDIRLEVRHTPGHSPGSVTLVDHAGRRAFTGDALFAGSVGRHDFTGGDRTALLAGIRREILSLPDDYAVLPGHGPASTVGRERSSNPFLTDEAWT